MSEAIEVWQGRVFASGPDEAAMRVRDACGCGEGKLAIKEVWSGEWYEYMVHYERGKANENKG